MGFVVSAGFAQPLFGQTQTLIWENVYANGAIPGPVTIGGTTVSVSGGTPSGGAPLANHNTVQHSTRGAHFGYYYFGFDGTAQGQTLRTALNFSRPVDSLTLDLLDIDLSSWHDSVSVRGYNGTTPFIPSITFQVGATPVITSPGEITGTANHGNTSAGGNATLTFLQPLDSVVVVYFAGPRIAGDPAAQVLGFADLTWTLVRADLSVSKSGPDSVQVGDTFTYVVTTTNSGPDRADSVLVTDTLPTGMAFVSANRGGTHSSGVISWPRITTLASGASQVDSVTVTSTASGSTTNTAAAQTPFTTDSVPGNNTGTHTVVTTPVADLVVLKTGPPTVQAGDTITYAVQVTSLGPSAATGVVITDTLPATGAFVSASNGGTETSGVVTWPAVSSMTAADTVSYTVTFVAPATGTLNNVAAASSPVSDPTPANNTSSVSTSVSERADLEVVKTGPASANAGDTVSYSIRVTNLGPSDASSVVITDTLPATGTFVSASHGGTEAGGVVTWPTLGTMSTADTVTYTLAFVAPTTGSLNNVAAATSPTVDPSLGNNTSTVSTSVAEVADLDVLKTGPALVDATDTITYSVRVTNLGPSNAAGVVITDTLPGTGTFVSASNGGAESGGVVTWPTIASMTPADTVTYTVTFVAPPSGSLLNVAAATTTTSDPSTPNNTSSVSTSITAQADIDVLKGGPASANAGDTISYTIRVTNLGPSDASSVVISDTLPVSGTFVSASNGGSESGGVVTWPTVATMTPADTVTYSVVFVAPATGSLTNTAAAVTSTVDPNSGNNVSAVATTVTEQADLDVLKSGPATANAGDTVVYSVRVTNLGLSDAATVVITDTLPGTGTFVSATNGGVESGGVVAWPSVGTMTPADTVTYSVVFVAPATGTLTNVAAATSATADPTAGNNTSSVVTTVAEAADLEVVKSGPAAINANDTITYSVRVTNLGPSDAAAVVITDTLPGAGTFVSASNGGVESAGVVTWPTLVTMTPADTVTYSIVFVAPNSGTLTNVAAAATTTTDPTGGNNRSSVATSVTEIADVRVTKTGPTGALSGDTIAYVVTTTNLGPSTAAAVVVTDTLPGPALFVDATGGGTHGSGIVTWSLGALAPGATVVDTIRVQTTTNTTYVNVVAGTTSTSDPDPSNNDGSAPGARVTTVVPPAASDLIVTKTAPASVNAGDTIVYGVKVLNAGPDDAQAVVVTDTLPATGSFVSASGGGTDIGGVVTWPTLVNLAANDSVQYTVTFVAPPTGTLVNVAAATSATTDTVPGGERSSVTTTVVEQADVSVAKTGPATADAGDTIQYVITATNLGPSDAVDVVMADTVPTGLTFIDASRGGVFSALKVTWPALTIPAGGAIADTVRFTTTVAGSYRNIGFVLSSTTADPNTANDDGEHTVVVSGQADLELVKSGPASVSAGDTITYSVRVTNLGPSDATAVTITDTLPPTGSFVAASDGASESGGVVTWPVLGTMTTSDTVTYAVTIVAPGTGSLDNVAAVTSAVSDPSLSNNASMVSTSVSERSDLEVLKSGPAGANAGDTVLYTVTVTTLGPSDASSVVITDTLPGSGTFVSASNGGTQAGGIVTWPTIATMAPTDTVSYTVRFVAPGTGSLTNVAAATTTTTDPALANNVASVATTVAEQADIEVLKSGPATVNAGDTITYSIQVTNLGVTDAASVVITDTLPGTGTFITASDGGSESGGVVTWPTIGTMTAADTVVYTVSLIAPATGTLNNSAAATSSTADPNLPNNTSSVSTLVTERSDVDVLKSGPATANAGDTVTYSIRVTTLGPSNAAAVVITDTLPATGTFVSASNGGTASSGVVTWPTVSTMTPADTVTYTVTFVAPGAGTLNNVAAAVTTTADPTLANNRSSVSTAVSTLADLEVSKTGPATVVAGDTVVYSIRVTNLGVSDAANVVIADTLPGTGTFVSASNGGSESGGVVTWPTIGTMTPADTVVYTVRLVAPGAGTLQNTATVASATTDPVGSNNSSVVGTSVSERADLEVLKAGPAGVNAADTVTYSVRVTNLGPSDAASVVIADTLPATGTFVSASDGGTVASGVVTWPTIATMTTADTVTYTLRFVAPTTGTLVNRAAASTSTVDPNAVNDLSSVSTTVAEMADVDVQKTGPATTNAGDTITYSIQVTNLGASDAANVIITDTLPATGTFVSATDGGAEASGVVTWPTITSMTTADTVTYMVTFVAPASGTLNNVAAAESSTPDPDSNNNNSSASTAVSSLADLDVLKTGPATINAADTITYTVRVTNLGPSNAASVVISDTLPASGTFVSASNGATHAAGVVTWPTLGTMTPADTVAYTVVFVAPSTGALSNIAAATTTTAESTSTNNRGVVGTTVTEVADLQVGKTGPVGAFVGDTIAYEITVTNVGPSTASGVTVTDTLPGLAAFVDATGGGAHAAGVVSWSIGSLASGSSVVDTVRVRITVNATYLNIAAASATTFDPDPSNNNGSMASARVTTNAPPSAADLVVVKTGPAGVSASDTITYSVIVTNGGPNPAQNVVVTDTLPTLGTFVSATAGGIESGGVVTWPSVSTMTVADTLSYTVRFVAPTSGSIANLAAAISPTTDTVPANNTSTVNTTVSALTDVAVAITGPPTANAGDTITYTVQVTNNGPSDAANVVVADTLPTTGTFVSASSGGVESGGTVTWSTVGTMTPADTLTYTVVFVVPATGSLTSSATVSTSTTESTTANNVDAAPTSVSEQADLEVVKTGPATANAGDTITYTIRTTNNGPSTAASVVVTDTLPGTGTFVSASNGGAESGGVITWPTVASMTPADTATYTVVFVAPASGSITNIAAASSSTPDPTTTNNDGSGAGRVVTAISDLADVATTITGPATANAGDTIVYTVTVTNNGPSDASNVIIADTLPPAGTFVSASNGGLESGGTVTWPTVATMTPTDTLIYTVSYVVPTSGVITSTATAATSTTESSAANNVDAATTTITAQVDLDVLKTGPPAVNAGDTLTYSIRVTNLGPSTAATVVITDTLPSTGAFVSASNGGVETGGVVVWPTIGSMTVSDTVTYSVTFVAPTSGSLTNTAAAASATADLNTANNSSSVATTVASISDVAVSITAPTTANAGDTITYTVQATNNGPSDAATVVVADSLPAGGAFVGASNGGTEAGGTVTWPTLATMTPADTVTYTVTYVLPPSGTVTSTATVSTATTESTTANNVDAVSTSISAQADLQVVKAGPANVNASDTVVYTLTLTNNGPSTAASVVVTDTLPGTGALVSASGGGVESSGVITWPTIASVTPADTVTYTVRLVAPSSGTITNISAATSSTSDPDPTNNDGSGAGRVTTSVAAVTDVAVDIAGPATANAGDTIVYTVQVTNNGPSDAASVVIADSLPATGTFVSASNGGTESGGTVTWPTLATMTPADTVTYTVTYVAPSTGTLSSTATVSTPTTESSTANNVDPISTVVVEQADLEIVKTGPATALAVDTIMYTIRVVNRGPSSASNVIITDTLPSTDTLAVSGQFIAASDGGTESGEVVTWPSIPTMLAGDTLSYTVTYQLPDAGPISNRVGVTSSTPDPNPADNTDGHTVAITPAADVQVTKTGPATALVGDTIMYVLTTSNAGPNNASSVVLTDSLPSGAVFVDATGGGTAAAGVVTWTLGSLGTPSSRADTVRVRLTTPGSHTNIAAATAATTDTDPTNNDGSGAGRVTTTVGALTDVVVAIAAPATANAGDTILYTVTVTNNGPSGAASVVIADTLAPGGTFVSASNGGTASGGVVTWPAIGSVTPTDTIVYTVAYVVPATGSITNTATVSTPTTESTTANNVSAAVTAITEVADLRVTKSGPVGAMMGDTITYVLTTTNLGPSSASTVVVTDSLPAGVLFVDATGGGAEVGGVVTWTIGVLPSGNSVVDTVRVGVPANATYVNVAAGSTSTFDSDASNNNGSDPSARVTTVVPPSAADLVLLKSGPASVVAADTVVYTLTVTNAGPDAAQNVVVTDTLPAAATFIDATGGGVLSSGVVTWPLVPLMTPADTSAYTVRVIAPATGSLLNKGAVTSPTADTVPLNNTSSVATTVTEITDVVATISAPATANPGDTIVYTVTITNNGPSDALNVVIADSLPATGTFVGASDGGVESGGTVTWPTVGTIAPTDTIVYTVTYVVPAGGTLTSTATASTPTTESTSANNVAAVVTNVVSQADLEVDKTGPATVNAGDTIVYLVRITNLGPSDASSVVLTDTLPSSGAFVGASNGGTESGGVVTWPTLATVTPADTVTYSVTFVAPASGTLNNIAAVGSATADPNSANDRDAVITLIGGVAAADLSVIKTGPASVNAGDTITYGITVRNAGPDPAASVVLTDTLPATGTFVSASGGGVESGGVITWPTVASLAANDSLQFSVVFVAPTGGTLTNVAVATSATADTVVGNERSSVSTSVVVPSADLEVVKTGPAGVNSGDTIVYTIRLTNLGPNSAAAVVVTDTLPATGNFISASGGGINSSGVVTWPALTTVTPSDTVTYTVTFEAPASGVLTNIAAASTPTSDPDATNNNGTGSGRVVTVVGSTPAADIAVTKAGPATAIAGDTITYNVKVVNRGPDPAANVVVTDSLPATGVFVSASNGATQSGGVVTWPTIGTLASNDSVQYVVALEVPASGSLVNAAAATSSTADTVPGNEWSAVTTTIGGAATQADVRVTKSGPATAQPGDTLTYTIVVTNDGPATATSVVTIDQLPTGMTLVSASGGGSLSGSTVTWPAIGTLVSGASASYTVRVTTSGVGTFVNTASASTASVDADATNNDGSSSASRVTTTIASDANLSVTKSGPGSVKPGDTIAYTIVVANAGPSSAANVALIDSLPPGLNFIAASNGGVFNNGVVTWPAIGSMAANSQVTRTVHAVGWDVGVRTNVVTVSSATPDRDPKDNRDTAVTAITAAPDLAIEKTHSGSVVVGQRATYTLVITNVGQGPTGGVITVVDTLPNGLSFVSGTGPGWTFTAAGQVVTATRSQSMATNSTTTLNLIVDVDAAAAPSVVNRAHVATSGDEVPDNDRDTDVAPVGLVDLSIVKLAVGEFNVGDTGTFTFTVTNDGDAPNTDAILVVDTLPAGLTYAATNGIGWSSSQTNGVVTSIFNGTLQPGASTTFSMDVVIGALASGPMENRATVSTPGDPGDTSTATFDVASGSDLVIEKTSSSGEVEVGDVVDYALVVSAVGAAAIPGISIVDELPPGFRYVPGTSRRDGQAIPDPTGGTGPELGWYVGDLPAGGSVTLTYRVQVGPEATTGDGINRATAQSPRTGKRSNVALAAVRLRPGAFTDEGLILGKVYVECGCEIDGQGLEELGVPGVRVLLQDGTSAITDVEGKYHFFGLSPRNWVVKVDPATLPRGTRLVPLTNRHGGDGSTVLVDLKSGELARADFADGSQSNEVIQDVKARRSGGEVNTLLLDPTAPEQVAAQRAVTQPSGTVLFRSIVSRSPQALNNRNSVRPADAGDMARLVDSTALTDTGAPTASIELERPGGLFTADGVTTVPYTIRIVDGGTDSTTVTLEATDGRWLSVDVDRAQPGMQIALVEGQAEVLFQAPDRDGRVEVRAYLSNEQPTRDALFFQDRGHDMLAAGLIEARLELRSLNLSDLLTGARRNRFEDALTSLSTSSDEERFTAGTRASLFAQGRVRDDMNLTLRLDTEEDDRSRLFRDIRPDEFYPVYGDAAIQAFDAQSKGRLFGRLDRGASYLQYGDFNTAAAGYGQLGARELGRYSRTLNGLFQHSESERYSVNAFASRDRFMQVVDEIRGQGISGPYQLSRAEGLVNSERVELVTRDRNQPAVILGVESLERYTDYSIEPFSGRLIFKRPIPSVDPELNPVAIRVTYEVETGGDAFWIYGADGQLRANDRLELGAGYVRDDNGQASFDLASLNATVALGANTFLVGEWARSDSADVTAGDARRIELRHGSKRLDARVFYLDSDTVFQNPSAAFGAGRNELGFRGYARINDKTALFGEGLRTENRRNGGVRRGWSAGAERAFGDWLRGRLGYRWADETTAPATTTSSTAGATPNETHAVSARLTGRLFTDGSVFGEFEQDVSEASQRRLAVGGDYRLLGRARLYGRHEFITSLAGPYALNTEQERNTTVFGIAADVLPGQSVFSEYRMRDAVSGREAQAAVGLRNRWEVREGIRLSTSFERLAPVSGDGSGATAVTGSVDYTANPLWRGSARAEYRAADSGNNLFGSVGYARKLSRDWTFLGNSVFSTVVDGDRAFERTRLGFAYRQTDQNRWSALGRYEHRYDRNPDLSQTETLKKAHVFAGHLNYQPNLDLILRGQWASKWASERSGGFDTNTQAHLAGVRATLDVTDRWDVGAIGRVLMAGAIEAAQWGLGGEVGLLLKDDLRLSAGYNVFGFDDGDISATDQTDHGFYVQVGFKFDEGLFGGWRSKTDEPDAPPIRRPRPQAVYQPNRDVRRTQAEPVGRDTLLSVDSRISDERIAEDLLLIDHWMTRAAAAADTTTAQGRYGAARAIALAGIAKIEYTDNDRTDFTASLVREVKRTVLALEASNTPVLPEPRLEGTAPVAEDLWTQVRLAKDSDGFSCSADQIARLEATLLWAGNEELTCSIGDPRPHLERAYEMAANLREEILGCSPPDPAPPPATGPVVPSVELIVPNVVHFAYDRSDIDAATSAVLDSIAAVLVSNPTVTIAVHGHTDVRGSQRYNQALGARRAGAVMDYLVSRGVDHSRMRTLSSGEAENYRAAIDERDHALNRRVEVRFLTPAGTPIGTRRQERDLKPLGVGPKGPAS